MLNVLFIAKRWCGYNEAQGICWLSDVYHDFYTSLNTARIGDFKIFEYDYEQLMGNAIDDSLINLCNNSKFDVVIFISYFEPFCKFKETTWNYLKNTLNLPIVFCHGDVYDTTEHPIYVFDHYKYADLVVHYDTDLYIREGLKDNPPKLFLTPPLDSGIYFDPGLIRDTPIIFPGSLGQYQTRNELLNYIQNVGLPIKHIGGRNPQSHISAEQYALSHMRAKISVCLSHNYNEHHLIAHIFESMMCGCCTFINKMRITRDLFKENTDYIEYENLSDLADKLIYYLDNEDEANEIAKNGKIAVEKYNAYNFYNTMFTTLSKINSKFEYRCFL